MLMKERLQKGGRDSPTCRVVFIVRRHCVPPCLCMILPQARTADPQIDRVRLSAALAPELRMK